METRKRDISLVVGGEAGQGIQTVEQLLLPIFQACGYYVHATKEYMSRIRGGSNSIQIRIASTLVAAPLSRIDILIPLDKDAIPHLDKRISKETILIGEKDKLQTQRDVIDAPFSRMAGAVGGPLFTNMISVGVVLGILNVEKEVVTGCLRRYFSKKTEDVIQKNIQAVNMGYQCAGELIESGQIPKEKISFLSCGPGRKEEILINGAQAVGIGALAGGCNVVSSYPMSPSTPVLVFLCQHARQFGVVAEQAEDEISAINMAIGAWYAGGRAMVTTSGGGFALMEEGISLAAMTETPVVVHLAQRPGPATGLPTRTEQGDLELALYSGHGEFPRIIFAPGKIEDALFLSQRAFNLADQFQIPVFILTDQYFIDSYQNVPMIDFSGISIERHILETQRNYQRYPLTDSGISPRGIPGYGEGLVKVDSDEHDENGHITEDMDVRTAMVDKRLRKLEEIKKEIIPPELIGKPNYKKLVLGWGSTYSVLKEAVENIGRDDVALLHFKQVYPLHPVTERYLSQAEQVIAVENNATGQFAKLIKLCTGVEAGHRILKYNGMAFFVEELTDQLQKVIG